MTAGCASRRTDCGRRRRAAGPAVRTRSHFLGAKTIQVIVEGFKRTSAICFSYSIVAANTRSNGLTNSKSDRTSSPRSRFLGANDSTRKYRGRFVGKRHLFVPSSSNLDRKILVARLPRYCSPLFLTEISPLSRDLSSQISFLRSPEISAMDDHGDVHVNGAIAAVREKPRDVDVASKCAKPSSVVSGGNFGDGDYLSSLPDDVLLLILLRLPSASTAARTSIVSRRWRMLWADIPELSYFLPTADSDHAHAASRRLRLTSPPPPPRHSAGRRPRRHGHLPPPR